MEPTSFSALIHNLRETVPIAIEHLLPLSPDMQYISDAWVHFHAWSSLLRLLILYLAYFVYSRMSRYYETNLQLECVHIIDNKEISDIMEPCR